MAFCHIFESSGFLIISVKLLESVSTILYVDGVDVGVMVTLLLRRKRKLRDLMPTVSTGRTITLRLMSSIHSALAQTLNLIFPSVIVPYR